MHVPMRFRDKTIYVDSDEGATHLVLKGRRNWSWSLRASAMVRLRNAEAGGYGTAPATTNPATTTTTTPADRTSIGWSVGAGAASADRV